MPVVHDPAVQAPLDAAVRPLVAVAARRDLPWTFRVVNTTDVNAFAIPGGHIYVTRGLIEHATSYNQLAGVLGHEIGHVDLRHTARQIEKQRAASLGVGLGYIVLGRAPAAAESQALNVVAAAVFARFSREDERAADHAGVRYTAAAGIDPRGLADMFHILQQVQGKDPGAIEQFFASHPMTADRIADADDLPPAAVKSGMLGSAQLVETVAAGIARRRLPSYVLDPVMVATSGDRLLDRDAEQLIARRLVPLARLVTPNLDEAAILTGGDVRTPADMERAGRALLELGARAALVKGGHLAGDQVVDVLVSDGTVRRFSRPRLDTTSTHGTGCTLSAAITAGLAHGRPLERAVEDALDFVHRAIAAAPGLGKGHGPLNHFVPAPPRPPTDGL